MSYPPPIYPPLSVDAAWPGTRLDDAYPFKMTPIPETLEDNDDMHTELSILPIEEAQIQLRKSVTYPAWPVMPPLTHGSGCSMFPTRPSVGFYVSVGDNRFRDSPTLVPKPRSVRNDDPLTEDNKDARAEPAISLLPQTASDLPIETQSPAPSPPASPALSACSFSSCSEFQMSPIKLPFSVSIPQRSPSPSATESGPAPPLTFDFPHFSADYMPSSSPPHSSPTKLFSSSPMASSQSSLPCLDSDDSEKDMISDYEAPAAEEKLAHISPSPPVPRPPSLHSPSTQDSYIDLEFERGLQQQTQAARRPLKRTRSEDELEMYLSAVPSTPPKETAKAEAPSAKRVRLSETSAFPPPPAQKRSTFASQKLQHKKLATPFRPLAIKKRAPSSENDGPKPKLTKVAFPSKLESAPSPPKKIVPAKRKVTPKAASQFKSPLEGSALAASAALSSVRLTPNIQALERKVQILKRAVKVRQNGEEETLAGLVKKWTEAGREVAWEVWGLVKDSGGDVTSATASASNRGDWADGGKSGNKRGFDEGWGWDDKGDAKKMRPDGFERNWGWNVERSEDSGADGDDEADIGMKHGMRYEEEEEEKRQDTLGTMLRHLGIAPETLGWDEDEGEFVGEY